MAHQRENQNQTSEINFREDTNIDNVYLGKLLRNKTHSTKIQTTLQSGKRAYMYRIKNYNRLEQFK